MRSRILVLTVAVVGIFAATPARAAHQADDVAAPLAGFAQARPGVTFKGTPCRPITVPAVRTSGTAALAAGGLETCNGVRPGALLMTPMQGGSVCTFNFLFRGADRALYAGTAGHCILDGTGIGETDFAPGTPGATLAHWAEDASGRVVGEFAYAVFSDPRDFALVRLNPAGVSEASAQLCHFGGPTGLNDDRGTSTVLLHHFGNGLGFGTAVPARTAMAQGLPDPDIAWAQGAVMLGDSGSGIVDDAGRAVGVIVAISANAYELGVDPNPGPVLVTRLAPQLRHAQRYLHRSLTLLTAPPL